MHRWLLTPTGERMLSQLSWTLRVASWRTTEALCLGWGPPEFRTSKDGSVGRGMAAEVCLLSPRLLACSARIGPPGRGGETVGAPGRES